MSEVVPAIIPTSRRHLDVTLEKISVFADSVQIDIVDGVFVDSVSWPYVGNDDFDESLGSVDFSDFTIEYDLMIKNPEETLKAWLKTGAEAIVVHVESTEKLDEIVQFRSENLFKLGLAFNNDTDLSILENLDRAYIDYVQLMGIARIGVQGEPFDERVLDRVHFIKKTYPDMPVSIDGSVNFDTISRLRDAGAERFISGSAILKSDNPQKAFQELTNIARGVV